MSVALQIARRIALKVHNKRWFIHATISFAVAVHAASFLNIWSRELDGHRVVAK